MYQCIKNFFFCQISPLISKGREKILTFDDLLEVPPELQLDRMIKDPSINLESNKSMLWQILGEQKYLLKRAWSFYFIGVVASLSSPLFVNQFITKLTLLSEGKIDSLNVLPIALGLGLIGIFMGIGYQHNFYATLRANVRITSRLNRLIFEQALVLSQDARQEVNVGDVVNHMSSDSESIADVPMLIGDMGWAFLLLFGSLSMFFYFLGWTGLIAVLIIGILTPITRKIAKSFMSLEEILMKKRDERVTLMGQVLQSMRLVKYFVWEEEINKQVGVVRSEEVSARKRLARSEMLSGLSFVAITTLVLFFALWIHLLRGENLTPALVLTCVSLFGLLQEPIAHLPGVLSRLTNAWVSLGRIRIFLNSKKVDRWKDLYIDSPELEFDIVFNNISYRALKSNFLLNNCNFKVKKGSSLAIVGEVGSGKTTILQLILNEFKADSGTKLVRTNNFGYVGQESYIMNTSILENVKMGLASASLHDVLDSLRLAGLSEDIERLPGSYMTELGEKGVNLSGGQKQRLCLARCHLHNPEIILLDDPLSAVDIHTEEFLVQHLIFGAWKNKTRVVVTHRLDNLTLFDQVLFLKNGEILGCGKFEKLLEDSLEFRHFYSHHKASNNEVSQLTTSKVESTPVAELNTQLMSDEDRESGAVRASLYIDYIKALGGRGKYQKLIMFSLVFGVLAITAFPLFNQWWLSWFTSHSESITPMKGILIYGTIALISLLVQMANQLFWLKRGIQAGIELHDRMLESVLKAPVRFFDTTPVGRLLQRFSRDLESVDFQLQWNFETAIQALFQVLISLFLIIFSVPIILIIIIPLGFVYWQFQLSYRRCAREVKRMDSIFRSPRYAHFKETLGGLPVIRAYNKIPWFREQFFSHLEKSQKAFVNNFLLNRWFSIRIPMIGGIISGATALSLIYSVSNHYLSPASAGLVTLYSMSFWGALNWGIRILSDLESKMTSIERIKFMTAITGEKSITSSIEHFAEKNWPVQGKISFENVYAAYDESLPDVINGLTFEIPAGSQVGIIGRTGAGKTTIFQMIYRFMAIRAGSIKIDGVDISSIDLKTLRSRLAIIPQDPTLFIGTLRSNLDPYSFKSVDEIWKVLELTGLSELVKGMKQELETPVSDGGANLSQGQRQLFCLARALLLDAKIIMLDEATASIDVVSDYKIQAILRSELKNKTVLIIAHRLSTVDDLDYVMELSQGRLLSLKNNKLD